MKNAYAVFKQLDYYTYALLSAKLQLIFIEQKVFCIWIECLTYNSIYWNFKSSNPWYDLIVGNAIIFIWDQLTVDVAHGPYLRYQIENNCRTWTLLFNGTGNYILQTLHITWSLSLIYLSVLTSNGVLFILVGIVSGIPLMHLTVFTMFDHKDFVLTHF